MLYVFHKPVFFSHIHCNTMSNLSTRTSSQVLKNVSKPRMEWPSYTYTARSYRWVGVMPWVANENNDVHLKNGKQVFQQSRSQKLNSDLPEFYSYPQNDSLFSGINSLHPGPRRLSGYISHQTAQNTSSVLQMEPPGLLFTSVWSHSSSNISNHV